jgi:hypothetical protein
MFKPLLLVSISKPTQSASVSKGPRTVHGWLPEKDLLPEKMLKAVGNQILTVEKGSYILRRLSN